MTTAPWRDISGAATILSRLGAEHGASSSLHATHGIQSRALQQRLSRENSRLALDLPGRLSARLLLCYCIRTSYPFVLVRLLLYRHTNHRRALHLSATLAPSVLPLFHLSPLPPPPFAASPREQRRHYPRCRNLRPAQHRRRPLVAVEHSFSPLPRSEFTAVPQPRFCLPAIPQLSVRQGSASPILHPPNHLPRIAFSARLSSKQLAPALSRPAFVRKQRL